MRTPKEINKSYIWGFVQQYSGVPIIKVAEYLNLSKSQAQRLVNEMLSTGELTNSVTGRMLCLHIGTARIIPVIVEKPKRVWVKKDGITKKDIFQEYRNTNRVYQFDQLIRQARENHVQPI